VNWLIGHYRVVARALAWIGILAIIVLSVVPAADRPVTDAGQLFEHFTAFALVAGVRLRKLSQGKQRSERANYGHPFRPAVCNRAFPANPPNLIKASWRRIHQRERLWGYARVPRAIARAVFCRPCRRGVTLDVSIYGTGSCLMYHVLIH
jgi:hypothetical protein